MIGFGEERKPRINYDVDDFVDFLIEKLGLSEDTQTRFILIGHSMGALLAKELTLKFPDKIIKSFLISYPFLDQDHALQPRSYYDMKYAEGARWAKLLCQSEVIYKWLFYPFILLFRYKYRRSYMDAFKHTYQSAYGAIKNTIFEDQKDNLYAVSTKVVLINGEHDRSVDLCYSAYFDGYIISGMGHVFFGHERKLAAVIKSNIQYPFLAKL